MDVFRGAGDVVSARRRDRRVGMKRAGVVVREAAGQMWEQLEARQMLAGGTWTAMTNTAPAGLGTMILLTDGSVMAEGPGVTNTWYKLTPDSSGNYVNGTWSTLASMSLQRLYFGSKVLKDGRVLVLGGEYSGPSGTANWINSGEIYNPVSNSWSSIPNFPQSQFGDDPTALLPDGRVLAGYLSGPQTYIYDPTSNTWSTGGTKLNSDRSDEESWIKLPDDSILSYNIFGAPQGSERYIPATNSWVAGGTVSQQLHTSGGKELGPGLLLPNGRALQIGATNHNAIYDPATDTWTNIPDTPGNIGANDAPGAMMPNGVVLYAAGDTSTSFNPPTTLFEYDPIANTITNAPVPGLSLNVPPFVSRMLMLPTGQVMFHTSGNRPYIYTPTGSPQASWRPTITNIVGNGSSTYTLYGTQLNGISEGAAYGDDAEMSSNYPIVRVSDSTGTVKYARSFNWSSTGVQTGAAIVSTQFLLPAGINPNAFTVTVSGAGISSNAAAAPGTPVYVSPANGASGLDRNGLTLDWGDVANATSYDVYLDDMTTPVANVSTSQWTISPQTSGGAHSWKIVADGPGGSTAGPTWTFSVAAIGAPDVPSGPNHNGDIVTAKPVLLDWNDSNGAVNYDVWVQGVFNSTVTVSQFSYSPTDGIKTWKIIARNSDGALATGPQWQYTLDTTPPSAAYQGATPSTGTTVMNFTVLYNDSTSGMDVTSYDSNDITVTGPNGYSEAATYVTRSGNLVTYSIPAPGGIWNDADNGTYFIKQNANEIRDLAGNYRAASGSSGFGQFVANLSFAWMSGSTLNMLFDGTTTPITLATSGSNITANKNASTPSFAGVTAINVIGTNSDDLLKISAPLLPPMTFGNGSGNDSVEITTGTYTFNGDAGGANHNVALLVDSGAAAVMNASQNLANLTVNGTATLSQNGNRVILTRGLSVSGRLDLVDNDLALNYTGSSPIGSWTGSAYTGVSGMLAAGRSGGTWSGNGIVTSMSAAISPNVLTTLGVAEAGDVLDFTGGATQLWDGQTVDATTVLVKYTYGGDANLDGTLNGDDYFQIDSHFNQAGSVFGAYNGDFNLDGEINGDDYFIIDSNWNVGSTGPVL